MSKKITAKAAREIGELFNTITVSRGFTDDANTATPEGRDVWVRWYDNAVEAARTLRDVYGITVPYYTDAIDTPPQSIKWFRMMRERDQQAADRTPEQKTAAAQEWIAGTARSLMRSAH